jgi:hypothetical protein
VGANGRIGGRTGSWGKISGFIGSAHVLYAVMCDQPLRKRGSKRSPTPTRAAYGGRVPVHRW